MLQIVETEKYKLLWS